MFGHITILLLCKDYNYFTLIVNIILVTIFHRILKLSPKETSSLIHLAARLWKADVLWLQALWRVSVYWKPTLRSNMPVLWFCQLFLFGLPRNSTVFAISLQTSCLNPLCFTESRKLYFSLTLLPQFRTLLLTCQDQDPHFKLLCWK